MRAVVVDDSVVFRKVVTEALERIPDIQVVGTAFNGKLAVQRILELHPDLVTLDIEMPEMDGLQVLEELARAGGGADVIVLSGLSSKASILTVEALERGAFDFITKPVADTIEQSKTMVLDALRPRVEALRQRRTIRAILGARSGEAAPARPVLPTPPFPSASSEPRPEKPERSGRVANPEMILMGVSTGGPNALAQVLPSIPANLGLPILIVQHMPPLFTASLAESLDAKCAIRVKEAEHDEELRPDTAYIAPGGRHMRVAGHLGGKIIRITDDPPENNCRPSVDYLFRSAANGFPGRALAVILTGMGSDGTLGLRLLKRHGCHVIVQDEASCVVHGMPRAALEAGVVDVVAPLDQIAVRIASKIRGGSIEQSSHPKLPMMTSPWYCET